MPLFSNRYIVLLHCFGGLFWLDFVQVFQPICREFLSLFEAILEPFYWLVLFPSLWTLASLFCTTLKALSCALLLDIAGSFGLDFSNYFLNCVDIFAGWTVLVFFAGHGILFLLH